MGTTLDDDAIVVITDRSTCQMARLKRRKGRRMVALRLSRDNADHSVRIATIGCTAAARRADGMPARTATRNDVAAATV